MNLILILQGSDFCKEQTSEFILEHKSLSIISLLVNLSLLKITNVYFKFSYVLQNFAYTYRRLNYVWCFSQNPLRCLQYPFNSFVILLCHFIRFEFLQIQFQSTTNNGFTQVFNTWILLKNREIFSS